ncbi:MULTISPECIES: molybdopterin dinucleotide binding domain-containing protein [unclassified Adlercreutzia]|uniref:molybdopterin dinucleotide binding domain-containing protein n=1 Tax=unclassified Adlercreutzia TaxID=2636013 RepID=UPI0013EBAFC9|nr:MULTISPECIES: molybdopterin dinucleotide binding domain-containing protein [unclassified Adlercreutzia]
MKFENDLGKPWKYEEGDFTVVRSSVWSPPGCHPVGCGVKLYVDKEGRIDHVEGDENDPITKGRLCPRCLALKDYIYNPSRVTYPMKRARDKRGDADAWERCSWDEATDLVVSEWRRLTEKYGKETFAVFVGTGRDGMLQQDYILSVFSTPNLACGLSGFACYQPRMMAANMTIGALYPEIDYAGGLEGGYDDPSYTPPKTIVIWGKMPLASNGDGMFGHAVIDLMKRGAKIISVDPRVNWLATRSEVQLRVRPGTDAAMAMAWANIIISEDLYDHDFVENWCYGFDEFSERVKTMTPERAAQICEVDVEDIYKAVRLYATSKPASIAIGLALDQNPNGMQACQCIMACMALTGNLDVPGGNIVADMSEPEDLVAGTKDQQAADNNEQRSFVTAGWYSMSEELRNKCVGMADYPFFCTQVTISHADSMLHALETDEPYPIRMGWIQSTNMFVASASAETKRWQAAMERSMEFCFGTDCFITPTIQALCDVFLPLSTVAEHDSVNRTHYGAASIVTGVGNKAIEPLGEAKSDLEITALFAEKIGEGAKSVYEGPIDYLEKNRLEGRHTFAEVRELVKYKRKVFYWKYELGKLRPDGQKGFLTPTGRVELWSSQYQMAGLDPLPHYEEPALSPTAHPEIAEKYPFVLTTGARTFAFFHSEERQVPRLRELNPNPLIEVSPADAERCGVSDGQWVEIYNEYGSAKFKAKVTPTVRSGTVMAQHGWWFPEQDGSAPNLFGAGLSGVDNLVPVGHNNPMGLCAPYKCTHCAIRPLQENHDVDMNDVWSKFGKLV